MITSLCYDNDVIALLVYSRRSWQEIGLPVCSWLLVRARKYVCQLVGMFIKCTLIEAGKIEVVHLSAKCVRAKQVSLKY